MRSSWPLLLAPLLLACVDPAAPPGDAETDDEEATWFPFAPPIAEMETQCRYLLGGGLDDRGSNATNHLSFSTAATSASGAPVTASLFGAAGLRVVESSSGGGAHTGNDPWLVGVIFAGDGAKLRIDGVGSGGTPLYKISVDDGAGFEDVCDGGDAVVYAGVWSRAGLHTPANGRLTFACDDGAGFRCASWGYFAGGDPALQPWDSNQACTRMALADYCGDGDSNTVEGTHIGIYDNVGVNNPPPSVFPGLTSWPPPAGRFAFEAAWVAGAAPVPCLGHERWASMPPGPACGGALPDPRTDTTAKFCEDYGSPERLAASSGALLFNISRYQQLAMDRWHRGGDMVTTVDGYYQPAVGTVQPFGSGWVHDGPDSLLMRSLATSIDPSDISTVRVARSTITLDYVVARYAPPPGSGTGSPRELGYLDTAGVWQPLGATFVDATGIDEGLVFNRAGGQRVSLNLYRNAAGDLVSAVKSPGGTYALIGTVGFTMPPAQ